jgi:hypothetical protein
MESIAGTALFYLSFTRFVNGQYFLGSIILFAAVINYFTMYVKEVERIRLDSTGVELEELPEQEEEEEEEHEDPHVKEDIPPSSTELEEGEVADDETEPIKDETPAQTDVEFIECSQCGTLIEPDLAGMCNGCMKAVYCDENCQRTHWKSGHKEECKSMRKRKRGEIV